MEQNNSNELYHYGVLGMKWGQRKALKKQYKTEVKRAAKRYTEYGKSLKKQGQQNDVVAVLKGAKQYDRELKTAKDRYKQAKRNLNGKAERKKSQNANESLVKRKNVKEMSDDDLIQETRRINLENNYRSAQIRKQQLNPTKVSKGKAFVKKVGKDVLAAAATEASKNILRKFIEDSVADAIVKKKNTKIIKKQVIKNDLGTITVKKMKVK